MGCGQAGSGRACCWLYEADTAAYSGRLEKAREFSRRAVASAERAEEKETAASYEADAALREALFGNSAEARQRAAAALALSTGRDVQYGAALALALAGMRLGHRHWRMIWPSASRRIRSSSSTTCRRLHAQLALSRNDIFKGHRSSSDCWALRIGHTAARAFLCYPVYVRGEAYLGCASGQRSRRRVPENPRPSRNCA